MKRRTGKRKLTRLILAALMATGGGLAWSPSAEAVENWVTESTTISDDQSANSYRLSASGITFTVENGGKVGTVWSPESGNKFNLMAGGEFSSYTNYGGEKNNIWNIYGAATNTAAAAKIAGGLGNGDGEFSGNEVNVFQGAQISTAVYGGYSANNATVTKNTVMIAGGTFTDNTKSIYGGYSNGGKADGNTVSISGDTTNIAGDVYGGKANSGNATGNIVTISGGTVGDAAVWAGIRGGNSETRAADGNFVTITGGTINADIWGGQGGTSASNNEVTISGNVTFQATKGIHGGAAGFSSISYKLVDGVLTPIEETVGGTASNNIVKILSPISTAYLIGGECRTGGTSTGNTLNLGATGVTVGEGVSAFQTVAVTEDVAFADGATVLTSNGNEYAKGFSDLETLDISGATGLSSATATGKMTLLASGTENNFTTLSLKYSDGTAMLNESNTSQVVKSSTEGGTTNLTNGVALTTGGTTHTVSLDTANSYKNVLYTIAGDSSVKGIDLSSWNGNTYALGTAYTGTNIPVATGSFTAPDATTTILTSDTVNFFGTVSGARAYSATGTFTPITEKGVTLSGTKSGGVKAEDSGKTLKYYAETMDTQTVTLGKMTWDDSLAAASGYSFANAATIDATNLQFTFTDEQKAALSSSSSMTLVSDATGLTAGKTVTGADNTQTVSYDVNGAALSGTLKGAVSTEANAVEYQATGMTLDSVKLSGWNGTEGAVPTGWTANAAGVAVDTDGMETIPTATTNILTGTANYFANAAISGDNIYKETTSTEGENGVTLTVTQTKGVTTNMNKSAIVYEAGTDKKVTNVALGAADFAADKTLYDASAATYQYGSATIDASGLAVSFASPASAATGETMTLLAANDTLAEFSAQTKTSAYTDNTSVAGLTLSGSILGNIEKSGSSLAYTVTENKANTLAFGDMKWENGGAFLDHSAKLSNVSFDGAKVDTTNIHFTDLTELQDGEKTLVSNYGGTPGAITGSAYSVGVGVTGVGSASYDADKDALIFKATSEAALDEEMAHNTLMGAEVGLAALSVGNDFIGTATEGLGRAANIGADGVSTYARMGGGSMRQETGSHVDTHTWNAILAIGHKNEKEKSSTQYGAFFEYGAGNYTTHNGAERGDGSMHYTGGGLTAKWQKADGLYVEGSLRAGSVHDDARNVLRDAAGAPYSYETNAGYWGAHVGVGKEIALANGDSVDVYGKYFYNRKNGVDFNANGAVYDLDAVTSSVIRVGARYTLKRERWNFYGGLAYEHEMDGKAAGKVTAPGIDTAIRGADIKGGSGRLELGATMTPGKNSPWSLDLNVTGYAGKKQGVMGGVSVAWMF